MVQTVIKREGYVEEFDRYKINMAIEKAFTETYAFTMGTPEEVVISYYEQIDGLTDLVCSKLTKNEYTVEEIQDIIEETLIENGEKEVARKFIAYREQKAKRRDKNNWFHDDLSKSIWERKYRYNNETFDEFLNRVAGNNPKLRKLIAQKKFIFGGRIIAHRGVNAKTTYSNCYVMPAPQDNIESIFDTAKMLARTYSYGGGCGVDISKLRPRNALVNNSAKHTTGAVSFMELFDLTTGLIGQNGRRGALMISISDTHPDLLEFLDIKAKPNSITKANISVRVSDKFMKAVENNEDWTLMFDIPETGEKIVKIVPARHILKILARNNWDWAEPGMLFWDRISNWHLMSSHPEHKYEGVNPCLVGDTLIETVEGKIPIKDLVGKQPYVYCMDNEGKLTIKQATKVWKTRENAELVKVVTGKGEITCTPDHLIYTVNRGWVKAIDLKKGDKLKGLNRQTTGHKYCSVALSGTEYEKEHRFVARHFMDIEGKDVHHINGDGFDNRLSNLEVIDHNQHSRLSNTSRKIEIDRDKKGRFMKKETKTKRTNKRLGKKVGSNWYVKEVIKLDYTADVYDMTVPEVHNFIANEIVVHNCAEEPLMSGGACLLGSLNLSEFVLYPFTEYATFDFVKFANAVRTAVIGLNEVLDEGIDKHPLKIQRENARNWRQIGLGVMGIADMLIKMGIRYGSDESLYLCRLIARTMLNEAVCQSALLSKEFGSFPKYKWEYVEQSKFFQENINDDVKTLVKQYGLRNSQLLTIAPTGTISSMWGVSGGIEPIFAVSYTRKTESLFGEDVYFKVYTPVIKDLMYALNINKEEDLPDYVVTAHTLHWKDRVKMQSVWQEYIDASISSTVNLPNTITIEEVEELYKFAWKKGLKGVTIFRDGCKRAGVLTVNINKNNETDTSQTKQIVDLINDGYKDDKLTKCPECGEPIEIITGGCSICQNCGYSKCSE